MGKYVTSKTTNQICMNVLFQFVLKTYFPLVFKFHFFFKDLSSLVTVGDVTWGVHLWWMKSSFSPWFPSVLEGGLQLGRISSQSYRLKMKLNLSPNTLCIGSSSSFTPQRWFWTKLLPKVSLLFFSSSKSRVDWWCLLTAAACRVMFQGRFLCENVLEGSEDPSLCPFPPLQAVW